MGNCHNSLLLTTMINLPWPILAHATGLVILGLNHTFRPPTPGRAPEVSAMLGITTTAVGLCYLSTSYMPIHENHFLYASAPVRVLVAALAGLKLLLSRNSMSKESKREFLGVLLYDGIGGLLLGWWLGTFKGRIPGYWVSTYTLQIILNLICRSDPNIPILSRKNRGRLWNRYVLDIISQSVLHSDWCFKSLPFAELAIHTYSM